MRTHLVVAVAAVSLLAGCAASTGDFGLPDEPEAPCIVGTWQLDVADYSAQSESWLVSLNPDFVDFQMTGSGQVTFTSAHLTADIDLSSTVILLAGDQSVLTDGRNAYTGSGDWEPGDDEGTIDFTYWGTSPDPGVVNTADSAGLPTVDFFAVPSLSVVCTANSLELTSTGAPLTSRWHR